jgi:hypothetical protein
MLDARKGYQLWPPLRRPHQSGRTTTVDTPAVRKRKAEDYSRFRDISAPRFPCD